MKTLDRFLAAAVQDSPLFLDKERTITKACELIAEAGQKGARLVVFPEAFVAAYPDWVWLVPGGQGDMLDMLYRKLLENAITVPDEYTGMLGRAAREAGVYVIIGINERNSESSGTTLYNTMLYIDDKGSIMGKHRKLIPTGGERTVWGQGDGSTLEAFDTSIGKVSGLLCWENYMPLARHTLYSWGTQIYAAPTWDRSGNWLRAMRHIAIEGGLYVINSCQALHLDDIPDNLEFKRLYPAGTEWINAGRSCIVAPDGSLVSGPLDSEKGILYAEIDLTAIAAAKRMFDVVGHYARPDVFKVSFNQSPHPVLRVE